eukprot:403340199
MQKSIIFISATLALLGVTSATYSLGACPKPQLQQDFDINRYLGAWFEQARDHSIPWEHGTCPQARYQLKDDGLSLAVINSEYNEKTGEVEIAPANATCNGPACKVKFNNNLPQGDYRVLSTDYDNYAVVYSCTDVFGFSKVEFVWILTRQQEVTDEVATTIHQKLSEGVPKYNQSVISRNHHGADCHYLQ